MSPFSTFFCALRPQGFLALILFVLGATTSCSGKQTIERRWGATVQRERAVPQEGYGWYARAVFLEGQGHLELARQAYERARGADPRSGAAWAGLASTFCQQDPERARRLFQAGLRRSAERAPLYGARARCRLSWGKPTAALSDAQKALSLEPTWADASELTAEALEQLGRRDRAHVIRRALKLYQGGTPPPPRPRRPSISDVDRALRTGDLSRAQTLAAGQLLPGALAARALALQKPELARKQARLVSRAAPNNGSAFFVLAIISEAPDLTPGVKPLTPPPTDLTICLFTQHLARYLGQPLAMHWLLKFTSEDSASLLSQWRQASDPLLRRCAKTITTLP